jgi:branched-chain amino acid aminotransferase
MVQAQATKRGCDQVVWLDAVEHRWIEWVGEMNLFFVFGTGDEAKLVTPPLTGSILPGVIRDSLLTLALDLGYLTGERPVSVEEWRSRTSRGSITEAFACGTAATITPIGSVKSDRGSWTVGNGDPGPVTMRLRDALLAIQRGVAVDTHDWMHEIG